jgi:hypothetical protein
LASNPISGFERGQRIAMPIVITGTVAEYFLPSLLADVAVDVPGVPETSSPSATLVAPWLLAAIRCAATPANLLCADLQCEAALSILTKGAIDIDRLRLAHGALTGLPHASGYRDAIAWVNGRSPEDAKLVPPPSSAIEPLMSDLAVFLARTDVPVWIKQALAYYQLIHIHPFADGNGRLSRLLVAAIGATTSPARLRSMIVALALSVHRKAFTHRFDAMQAGISDAYLRLWRNLDEWACDFSFEVATRERELRTTLSELVGANSAPRLFDLFADGVALTEQKVAATLRWSAKNAPLYFTRLRDAGWANGSAAGFVAEPVRAAQRELVARVAAGSSTILL